MSILTRWKTLVEDAESATVDPNGARVAAYTAQVLLDKEKRRRGQTAQVTQSLHDLRTQDNFTDLIADTFGRRHA